MVSPLPLRQIAVDDLTGRSPMGNAMTLSELLAGLTEDRSVRWRARLPRSAGRAADGEGACSGRASCPAVAANRRRCERPRRDACLVDREDRLLEAFRRLRDIELDGALAAGRATVMAARSTR